MLEGAKDKSITGAVGNTRGQVENFAPVFDREVVFDGSGETFGPDTVRWAVLSDDTDNLTTSLNHVLGTHALQFDKVDGAGNTIFAGVVADVDLDLSRFVVGDRIEALFQVSAITDVAYVVVRLGTNASNYNEWRWDDSLITPAVWQEMSRRFSDCEVAVTGNGWDPKNVKYAAFVVAFDAQNNTLANILLDHVIIVSNPARIAVPAVDSVANVEMRDVIGNKLDEVTSNSVYALLHSIEEHSHSPGKVYPSGAGVAVTSGAGPWALSAGFTEVVPVSTIIVPFDIHFVTIQSLNFDAVYEIVLYAGTTEITRFQATKDARSGGVLQHLVQMRIQPPNTQIQAKCMDDTGGKIATISLEYHEYT